MTASPIPRIFEGRTVCIVAGGPSLAGFRWGDLTLANVIAINRAYEVLPFAKMLWWGDASFFRQHKTGLWSHGCYYKATFKHGYGQDEIPEWVTTYRVSGREGFDPDPACMRTGNNSTYAAMHLCAHLGAKRIVLFGVDMKWSGDRTHWHDGYGTAPIPGMLEDKMRPLFAGLVQPLAERGIEVINASPDSALDLWPRCSLSDGVRFANEESARRNPAG